ncbi:hypothetical protein DY000_02012445 [Brassica cretica]|uniref:Uncharacterized protein n=1 Tax=Brassica cretica TaxID=69181 RepID=A0ABQ7CSK1_BRACR|nr:hypothetical protein DY000_02012445 [Brassica cretica]
MERIRLGEERSCLRNLTDRSLILKGSTNHSRDEVSQFADQVSLYSECTQHSLLRESSGSGLFSPPQIQKLSEHVCSVRTESREENSIKVVTNEERWKHTRYSAITSPHHTQVTRVWRSKTQIGRDGLAAILNMVTTNEIVVHFGTHNNMCLKLGHIDKKMDETLSDSLIDMPVTTTKSIKASFRGQDNAYARQPLATL